MLGYVAGPAARHATGYATWEVAGTAHFDQYGLSLGATDMGDRQTVADWFNIMRHPPNQPTPMFTCGVPINTGPQTFVLRAAIVALNRWVAYGTPPPRSPRLETTNTTPPQSWWIPTASRWRHPHAGGRRRRWPGSAASVKPVARSSATSSAAP